MTETTAAIQEWMTSDNYPIHVAVWRPAARVRRGKVLILHGVQSHGGWYHGLGRVLAGRGYEVHFTDRRGSGANRLDRGYTPSTHRLLDDVSEYLDKLRAGTPKEPVALVGISWGGKLAVVTAAQQAELTDAVALICPGLHPRIGVSPRERLRIAWAYLTRPRTTFPIPLSDPALFTADPAGQAFIASDPLGLRAATAALLAASTFLDREVARSPGLIRQPALLMLADQDRIVHNGRTLDYWRRVAAPAKEVIRYPDAHHTLEFEPDSTRYACDLADWFDQVLLGSPSK